MCLLNILESGVEMIGPHVNNTLGRCSLLLNLCALCFISLLSQPVLTAQNTVGVKHLLNDQMDVSGTP